MKLVLIEWEDSRIPASGWSRTSNMESPKVTKVISVGFVLEDREDCLLLASNVGDIDDEDNDPQAVGGIVIAKRQITRIVALRQSRTIFSCGELVAMPKLQRSSP